LFPVVTTPFHLAGFFDGPWLFLVIVLASAVINWLSKRRAEQAGPQPGRENEPPSAPADWEERLRRLLGEEVVPPRPARPTPVPQQPAPPLLRPTGRPPVIRPAAPALRPPPVEVVPVVISSEAEGAAGGVEETVRRFEQLDPAVMTPVRPISAMGSRRSNAISVNLRQPQAARQAFVASLVFGPPKGLED
jgi:hypothetical protein